jgi:murein DD-endopeptidase MepM/ murein hydrolase activator NlpD
MPNRMAKTFLAAVCAMFLVSVNVLITYSQDSIQLSTTEEIVPDAVSVGAQGLAWPIDCIPGSTCSERIGYPDIDGDGRAFNCGTPGYRGHTGTDIYVSWDQMDSGVDVVAAADGEVLWVFDGKYDRCQWPSSTNTDCRDPSVPMGPGVSSGYMDCTELGDYCGEGDCCCFWCFFGGNVVVIRHYDETGAFATHYDHLKRDSIRVSIGEIVKKGQKIAEVGSSGRSIAPHLHLEVWGTGFYELADPWAGPCGPNDSDSLWKYKPPWNAPVIQASPKFLNYDYVKVGEALSRRVTVFNTGIANLSVGTIEITGQNTGSFTIRNDLVSHQVIAPSESKTLNVVFSPRSDGAKNASLSIPSNAVREVVSVRLRGVGLLPLVLLTLNGGVVAPSGSTQTIEWETPPQAVKFRLLYSMDGGLTWKRIHPDKKYVSETTYNWTVPIPSANKKTCLVKVIGFRSDGLQIVADKSDSPFTIEVVKVTSPQEGRIFTSGGNCSVQWQTHETKKPVDRVNLTYTIDGGVTWKSISPPLVGNPETYDWQTPYVANRKTKCRVKAY